jgi:ABC-type Fe3+-siderophore transport system permease subunit
VVPQLIRRLVSVDLRVMVPLSALCGALVLLLADIAARTLFTPWELATGIMTALVGAPVFIFMARGCSNEPGRIRAFRGAFSALVRPKALACLAVLRWWRCLLGFGLTHGSLPVPASAIGRALFSPESLTAETRYIVMDIRLPRLLMAVLCGAMLGMAGAAMQSITRNGLADPGLIGVKEGCSAAVLLLIFQFPALGLAWRPLVGMAGGLLTALLVVAWRAIFRARDLF